MLLLRTSDASLGSWIHDFRLCVDAQEAEGIPAQEARRTCSEGLSPVAPQPLAASTAWEQTADPALGSWIVEFRLCVDAQEAEGIPAQEARRTCSEGLSPFVPQPLLAPGPKGEVTDLRESNPTYGSWIHDFRLCVDAHEAEGIPAQEARRTCSDGLRSPE